MKLLMISDIHGYYENLKELESKISLVEFNYIILLGDLYKNYISDEKEYIYKFMDKYKEKLIVVKGNCDSTYNISKCPVKVEDVKYLNVDGFDFYFTHGNSYNYYRNEVFSNGILVYGHEHIPYIKNDLDMVYLNTGSLSLPRDEFGKTFAIYENKKLKIYQLDSMNLIIEKNV